MLKADIKQLKAIEESIVKWEEKELLAKKGDSISPPGTTGCPLCLLNLSIGRVGCWPCPIVIYGESKGIVCKVCRNTPFYKVSDLSHCPNPNKTLLLEAIREEIAFLKKVRTFWKKRYRLYKTKEK